MLTSGTKYFTLTAERFGSTFTQTVSKSVTAGDSLSLWFDELTTTSSSQQTGKVSVTFYFPSGIRSEINKAYAAYSETASEDEDEASAEEELEYNATDGYVTFTREKSLAGDNVLIFFAKNADGELIYTYPIIASVKAGYPTTTRILNYETPVSQDASRMVTVTYNVNDSSSSAKPYDQNYYPGSKILSVEDVSFTVSGKKFTGWNTQSDGSGTTYNENNSPDLTANVTLYAQWVSSSQKIVTYQTNYPSGVSESDTSITQSAESAFTVKTATEAGFSVKGYKFIGWNNSKDGSGTAFTAGNQYTVARDQVLYAQWQAYTITYDMNGGSDSIFADTAANTSKQGYATITTTKPTAKYDYYTFQGWSKSSTATSATYYSSNSLELKEDTTLYAVWKLGTIADDNDVITVSSSTTKTVLSFTTLKTESVTVTAKATYGALYYRIKNSGGTSVYYSDKLKEGNTYTQTISLPADTYTLTVTNENIFNTHNGTVLIEAE